VYGAYVHAFNVKIHIMKIHIMEIHITKIHIMKIHIMKIHTAAKGKAPEPTPDKKDGRKAAIKCIWANRRHEA